MRKKIEATFANYKKRGAWVELLFMTQASKRGFSVSKPWGDSELYDVVLELEGSFLRVQVKSTDAWTGRSYICGLTPGGGRSYTSKDLDYFGIYVLPDDVWYIFPASRLIGKRAITLSPHRTREDCESEWYREAWSLLQPCRRRRKNPREPQVHRPPRKTRRRDDASDSK